MSATAERVGNDYFDRELGMSAVKVLPGEYFVTSRELWLVTVLGSCVSACIRDVRLGIGGMNHFMLPSNGESGGMWPESARYGAYAMEVLVNDLLKLGARRETLEAKVFGGGAVMNELTQSHVGDRNAEFVLTFLRDEGIKLVAQDLLDIYPRKVHYFPRSGRARIKKLKDVQTEIARREQDYGSRLWKKPVGGDVEFFQ